VRFSKACRWLAGWRAGKQASNDNDGAWRGGGNKRWNGATNVQKEPGTLL
jgi:hypothetical protein